MWPRVGWKRGSQGAAPQEAGRCLFKTPAAGPLMYVGVLGAAAPPGCGPHKNTAEAEQADKVQDNRAGRCGHRALNQLTSHSARVCTWSGMPIANKMCPTESSCYGQG